MAANFPGEYEVRLSYQTDEPAVINQHEVRFSMNMVTAGNPGDPFSSFVAAQRVGAGIQLDTWMTSTAALLQPLFNTAVNFQVAELWRYTPLTFDAAFISTFTVALAGTGAAPTVDASQAIITFRSQNGGIMRLDLRGVAIVAGGRESFPTLNASINALAGWLTGATNPVVARDNGFPFSELSYLPGQNERAWKALNR